MALMSRGYLFGELEHEVYVLLVLEEGVQVDDVLVPQLAHDTDLILQLVDHPVVLDSLLGDHLHSVEGPGDPRLYLDHLPVGT